MFRRRRPIARAAVVGGAGYAMGRHLANKQNEEEQRFEDLEAAQAAPQAEPEGGVTTDTVQELERLAKLKEQGILTQEEFDEQKAKILGRT